MLLVVRSKNWKWGRSWRVSFVKFNCSGDENDKQVLKVSDAHSGDNRISKWRMSQGRVWRRPSTAQHSHSLAIVSVTGRSLILPWHEERGISDVCGSKFTDKCQQWNNLWTGFSCVDTAMERGAIWLTSVDCTLMERLWIAALNDRRHFSLRKMSGFMPDT